MPNIKKILLLAILATTLILANTAEDKAKDKAKDGAKSAVGIDNDKSVVEKKKNKAERKVKKKVIKTAI